MINYKLFGVILLIIVMIVNAANRSDSLPQCTNSNLKKSIDTRSRFCHGFDELYERINKFDCKIDSTKLRNYLIHLYSKKKLDSVYSYDDESLFRNVFFVLISNHGWNSEVEKIMVRERNYYRKKDLQRYYSRTWILIERTDTWFDYFTDVYNVKDSSHCPDRSHVYITIIDRFKFSNSIIDKIKVESILYSGLLNDEIIYFEDIDSYLVGNTKDYKDSNQRLEVLTKYLDYWEPIKIMKV